MTRTEERLTDALAARAAAVDSIRPLPAPYAARLRRHLTGRRWPVSLAPVAAAASIAAISAIVMLPQHHEPGRALAGLPKHSSLLGVAAVSASDAWAVGLVVSGRRSLPLILHWNGKAWSRSPIVKPAAAGMIFAVAAKSANYAWAVGTAGQGSASHPYILRWNGIKWRQVPTPPTSSPLLMAVTVISARNAWAVGGLDGAVILHWNGVSWRVVPNRWESAGGWLSGVVARTANDVWAVGTTGSNSLILHWNGTAWSRLGGPRFGRYGLGIVGVAVVSPHLTWLAGIAKSHQPLILRWSDGALRQLPMRSPRGSLVSVSAASATQAWAVGFSPLRGLASRSLIMRWQGRAWRRVPSPPRVANQKITSVFAESADDVWAVGYSGQGTRRQPRAFILHWNGVSWQNG